MTDVRDSDRADPEQQRRGGLDDLPSGAGGQDDRERRERQLIYERVRALQSEAQPQPRRVRDLLYFPLVPGLLLAVACDSLGGIGPKEADSFPSDPHMLGRFAVRVPLLELLSVGADPFCVVDTLSVEMEPTGAAILAGVQRECEAIDLTADRITGSTEENVKTTATGVGITVLGLLRGLQPHVGRCRAGDRVYAVGEARSAPADVIEPDDRELMRPAALLDLRRRQPVVEIIPVGSRGLLYEAKQLAQSSGLSFQPAPSCPLDPDQSGGPGTCVLAAVRPQQPDQQAALPFSLDDWPELPTYYFGQLTAPGSDES